MKTFFSEAKRGQMGFVAIGFAVLFITLYVSMSPIINSFIDIGVNETASSEHGTEYSVLFHGLKIFLPLSIIFIIITMFKVVVR